MHHLRSLIAVFLIVSLVYAVQGQQLMEKRSSIYGFTGSSGAKIRQFNELLEDRGLSPLRNRYRTYGLGYQTRINDFVVGFELTQHQSKTSEFDQFDIKYRTSRALLNVGYSLTEEGKFQLIHYMSLGMGYMNFQMLPSEQESDINSFLQSPQKGFILRKNDIQKGTNGFGDFLTEIGFQASYDFDLPGRKESLEILAKVGYSFSPFEGSWSLNGLAFDNAQAGAFVRVGAGISLPDRNFFYKDATISISLIRGIHFASPDQFNAVLEENGYQPLQGKPSNWGLRILGETDGMLYGVDVFNLAMDGRASNSQTHSLNSLRVYGNAGYKFFQYKNFAIGAMAGLGFGNLRYTLSANEKPDFPELFEQRYFDGYLRTTGLMAKPEILLEYGIPMTERRIFDLVISATAGYEAGFPGYKLGGFSMNDFMSAPFLTFGIGVRP